MPFRVVSGVGREMGVLDGEAIVEGEGAVFGGEFGASHCSQRGLRCIVVRESNALFPNYFGRTCHEL